MTLSMTSWSVLGAITMIGKSVRIALRPNIVSSRFWPRRSPISICKYLSMLVRAAISGSEAEIRVRFASDAKRERIPTDRRGSLSTRAMRSVGFASTLFVVLKPRCCGGTPPRVQHWLLEGIRGRREIWPLADAPHAPFQVRSSAFEPPATETNRLAKPDAAFPIRAVRPFGTNGYLHICVLP